MLSQLSLQVMFVELDRSVRAAQPLFISVGQRASFINVFSFCTRCTWQRLTGFLNTDLQHPSGSDW